MSDGSVLGLNVKKSLRDKRWVFPKTEEKLVSRISQTNDLPEFIARMLCIRGVGPDGVNAFLYPTLRDHFPDPFSMIGMEALAEELSQRIIDKKPVGVLADFDVDGATSAALLVRFFEYFGLAVPVYIPDRLNEGYGPNLKAFKDLKKQGADFIIVADCGITAFEPLQQAKDLGLRTVVLDHHEAEENLPQANHIINPKRPDDMSGLYMLAACGVCFMVCVATNKTLRDKGYYHDNAISEAPLKSWLDIVALGTVCDMVPMIGVNRLFVRTGFELMAQMNNAGIKALCEVANLETAPQPMHAGFVIGPRINAASRVHRSDLGAKLLSTNNLEEARSIAWTLEECNQQRREIQSVMIKQAIEKVESEHLDQHPIIIVGDPDWHPGLSGLVAGRLKDRFGKPAVAITYAENPQGVLEGRGSGRSIKGVNLAHAFIEARNAGLLVNGGGHAMAGGFTIIPDQLPDFRAFLYEHIEKQMKNFDPVQEMVIDSLATVVGAKSSFIKILQDYVGPFGVGNPEPVFALANVRLYDVNVLKDKHIRAQLSDWEGGQRIKTILFNGVGTNLGDALLKESEKPFHVVGQFQINNWQGRESVEFHLSDGAIALAG